MAKGKKEKKEAPISKELFAFSLCCSSYRSDALSWGFLELCFCYFFGRLDKLLICYFLFNICPPRRLSRSVLSRVCKRPPPPRQLVARYHFLKKWVVSRCTEAGQYVLVIGIEEERQKRGRRTRPSIVNVTDDEGPCVLWLRYYSSSQSRFTIFLAVQRTAKKKKI